MQALERVAKVETRYGGRYVAGVDGLDGARPPRDWFYFVNGYLADRSAADYRLRAGDVEWWDYRAWRDAAQDPVVVGAFPQPFLHGYGGRRRPAVVVSADPGPVRAARAAPARARARRRRARSSGRERPARSRRAPRARGSARRLPAGSPVRALVPRRPAAAPAHAGRSASATRSADEPGARGRCCSPALAAAALLADRIVSVAAIALVLLARLPARAGGAAAALPRRRARLRARGLPADAVRRDHRLARALERADAARARAARRRRARSSRSGSSRALRLTAVGLAFAAYALLLDHDRLLQSAALRPALGAGGGARDAARADARARRRRARRGAARARGGGHRHARPRAPAVAARSPARSSVR